MYASADFRRSFHDSFGRFPAWKLLLPAAMDGLGGFMTSVGGPNTPGSWSVLLGQCQVFFAMLFSMCLLGSSYRLLQILGAVLVVIGSSMAIVPDLFGGELPDLAGKAGYVIIFFCSDVPYALAAVYKDFAFKTAALDVFYLTATVSWAQLVISWCYLPLLSIPALGGQELSTIPASLVDGAKCFFGDTSVPVYNSDGLITGYCGLSTTLVTFCFSISGFLSGIMTLYIMKMGSATLYVLASALALPIANLSFSVAPLMAAVGLESEPFSWYNAVGVVMVVIGFVAYALVEQSAASEEGVAPLLDGDDDSESSCHGTGKVESVVDRPAPVV